MTKLELMTVTAVTVDSVVKMLNDALDIMDEATSVGDFKAYSDAIGVLYDMLGDLLGQLAALPKEIAGEYPKPWMTEGEE